MTKPSFDPAWLSADKAMSDFSSSAQGNEEDLDYAPLPSFSLDEIADQLTDGYWQNEGGLRRAFDTSSSNQVSVNIDGLSEEGQTLAQRALTAWSDVADLEFVYVSGAAQITFNDENTDASAISQTSGGMILSSEVNIPLSYLETHGT